MSLFRKSSVSDTRETREEVGVEKTDLGGAEEGHD
jgi:hypothetical protein